MFGTCSPHRFAASWQIIRKGSSICVYLRKQRDDLDTLNGLRRIGKVAADPVQSRGNLVDGDYVSLAAPLFLRGSKFPLPHGFPRDSRKSRRVQWVGGASIEKTVVQSIQGRSAAMYVRHQE